MKQHYINFIKFKNFSSLYAPILNHMCVTHIMIRVSDRRRSSNHTARICWRFAVDLLADRLYSKSPANPFDMVQNGQIYNKSTAFMNIDQSEVCFLP